MSKTMPADKVGAHGAGQMVARRGLHKAAEHVGEAPCVLRNQGGLAQWLVDEQGASYNALHLADEHGADLVELFVQQDRLEPAGHTGGDGVHEALRVGGAQPAAIGRLMEQGCAAGARWKGAACECVRMCWVRCAGVHMRHRCGAARTFERLQQPGLKRALGFSLLPFRLEAVRARFEL